MKLHRFINSLGFKNNQNHLDSFESYVALKKAVYSSNVFVQHLSRANVGIK